MVRSVFLLSVLLVSLVGLSACQLLGPKCTFCATAISTKRVHTAEGFDVCRQCNQDAVRDLGTAKALVAQVRREIVSLGVRLPWAAIPIKMGGSTKAAEYGHCEALRYSNGTVASLSMRFMPGLPRPVFKAVAAHELTHAWAYLNRSPIKQDVVLSEGAPTFLEYTYLERDRSAAGKYRRRQIFTSRHPVYGEGTRRLQAYAKGHGGLAGGLGRVEIQPNDPKGLLTGCGHVPKKVRSPSGTSVIGSVE